MFHLNSLIKNLVPLVGHKAARGIILSHAVRNVTFTRTTNLKANPSVAKKWHRKTKHEVIFRFLLHFPITYLLMTCAVSSMIQTYWTVTPWSMNELNWSIFSGRIYLLHLRAPGQLWMRFWMVGCEKPKKSSPDGTMDVEDLELNCEHIIQLSFRTRLKNWELVSCGTLRKQWPSGGWRSRFEQKRPQQHSEGRLQAQSQTGNYSQPLSLVKKKTQKKTNPPEDLFRHPWFGRCRDTAAQGSSCWRTPVCCRSPLDRWHSPHGTTFCLWWSEKKKKYATHTQTHRMLLRSGLAHHKMDG